MANIKILQKCKDCGEEFEITPGEKKFYESQGWDLPKRCKACRDKRKAAKAAKGGGR